MAKRKGRATMAQPALKLATEIIKIAVANFEMRFTLPVERELAARALNLTDLYNALNFCEVERSNTSDAGEVYLCVVGTTTENVQLAAIVHVNTDCGFYLVEEIS